MELARHSAMSFVMFPTVYALSVIAGRATRLGAAEVALVWPAAAVATIWLIATFRAGRRERTIHLVLLAVSTFAMNILTGADLPLAGWFVVVNVTLAVVTVRVLTHRHSAIVLNDPADLARLIAAVGVGNSCAAVLATAYLAAATGAPAWETFGLFAVRNGSSALLGVSVWLLFRDVNWHVPRISDRAGAKNLLSGIGVAGVFFWTYWFNTGLPVSFITLVPAIWLALRYSTPVCTVFLAIAAVWIITATLVGKGALIVPDMQTRALLAQAMVLSLTIAVLTLSLFRDSRARLITELHRSRSQADQDSELLCALFDSIHDNVVLVDPDDRVILANARASMSGLVDSVISASRHHDFTGTGVCHDVVVSAEEDPRVLELTTAPLARRAPFRVMAFRDVTEERANVQALQEARDLFAGVLHAASEQAIVGTDSHGRITVFNHGAERLLGWTAAEMIGRSMVDFHYYPEVCARAAELCVPAGFDVFIHNVTAERAEVREWTYVRCDGSRAVVSLAVSQMADADGMCVGYIGVATDITARKRVEAELQHLATHDQLTGLANRSLFMARLEQAMAAAERNQSGGVGVVFLDLDGFKTVNDRWGHAQGDAVLKIVAKRLEAVIRIDDTAARLGGDEFAVLCPGLSDIARLQDVADRIRAEFGRPITLADGQTYDELSVSAGVAVSQSGCIGEAILHRADKLMYEAKRSGKNVSR